MIPPQVRYRLWSHNHGKRWLAVGGRPLRVIRHLYPEKAMAIGDLRKCIGTDGGWEAYKLGNTLWKLRKGGFVEGRHGGSYRLTDLGRWLAISGTLGLSFLELCVLACACCVQTRYAAVGVTGYYMRAYFERVLGEYYSPGYIDKTFSRLKAKGFATRYVKRTIRVYPGVCTDLMARYGKYLERLEAWLYELQEAELGIFERALEGFERDGKDMQKSKGAGPQPRTNQTSCRKVQNPTHVHKRAAA